MRYNRLPDSIAMCDISKHVRWLVATSDLLQSARNLSLLTVMR
jgi:hypothetical protein